MADVLPFSDSSSAGASELMPGVDDSCSMYLSSDFVFGPMVFGIRSSLLFDGVHLFLGHDSADDKVVINPVVTDNLSTCIYEESPIEQDIPGRYHACAVTRAQSKKSEVIYEFVWNGHSVDAI